MKKILLLIAVAGMLLCTISCGDDDDIRPVRTKFTVNTTMFNHMSSGNNLIGLATTQNKLEIDTVKHIASLELNYNDGQGNKQLKLDNITATPKGVNFFMLASPTDPSFKGYVDFSDGSALRYDYTTPDGIRVISMTPDVFFRNTVSIVTYDDTTKTTTWESAVYQFTISPSTNTATVKVMDILHAKDLKRFENITSHGVPFKVTANGFTINATDLKTDAKYTAYVDSTGSSVARTNKYPFKTFNATIDLANDKLEANYMIGGSATVKATGKTYRDQ